MERQEQLNNAELFNEIKERRKLAKVLLLDQRLIQLYKTLIDKPALKIEKGEGLIHAELSSSVVVQEGSDTRIEFNISDTKYTLLLSDMGGGCISYYGETFKSSHLTLKDAQRETVLTIHLNLKSDEREGEEVVSESQITAFVPGKWIYDIIHAYETLETTQKLQAITQAYSQEKIDQLKQKFGI